MTVVGVIVAHIVFLLYIIADRHGEWMPPARGSAVGGTSEARQRAVVEAMRHSWDGYRRCGFGADEIAPLRCEGFNWGSSPIGMTIVDALGTLHLMGLTKEFQEGVYWLKHNHTWDVDVTVSYFETNIRMIGGLISAYELSNEDALLEKALALGDIMVEAMPRSGFPYKTFNLKTKRGVRPESAVWDKKTHSSLAEAGTLLMEFIKLSELSGRDVFRKRAEDITKRLYAQSDARNLWRMRLDLKTNSLQGEVTFGARGDSFYEYMAKTYFLTGDPSHKNAFEKAYSGLSNHLLTKDGSFLKSLDDKGKDVLVMQHLACFLPGTLSQFFQRCGKCAQRKNMLTTAKNLAKTCHNMYTMSPTGLAPDEVRYVDTSISSQHLDYTEYKSNRLRPEAVESWYWLHLATRHTKYLEWGAQALAAFNKHSRCANGYHEVPDVTQTELPAELSPRHDRMHSFWMAETLKYLYLLFSDPDAGGGMPEGDWVFNTEAHLFRVVGSY